jgi:predicted transcriptional regulator
MSDHQSEFIRRKFTITESLDSVLEEMAAEHYQGNVSLCLRAAIESHQRTLRGEGEFAAQQVSNQLDNIAEQQQTLNSALDELSLSLPDRTTGGDDSMVVSGLELANAEATVYRAFLEQNRAMHIDDFVEGFDLDLEELHRALTRLVDLGLVAQSDSGKHRYRLAGQPADTNQGDLE